MNKNNCIKLILAVILTVVITLSVSTVPALTNGAVSPAITASAASAPAKVTGLKASTTTSSVKLTWKKVSGATGYIVRCYNTDAKKYETVANVTEAAATFKNLKSGTALKYAVKAYKTVNGKKVYGSYAYISTATKPAAIKSITYTVTTDTATLYWKKISGATGYKVYSYDAKTKKYTTVKYTTTNKAVIKNLKSATTYRYVVRAYVKSGDVNYFSALSPLVKLKTLSTKLNFLKYHKIVNSGTFYVSTTTKDPDFGTVAIQAGVKDGNSFVNSTVDGMDTRMIYIAKQETVYMVMDSLRIYTTMSSEDLDGAMKPSEIAKDYAPKVASAVTVDTVKIGSKTYTTEKYSSTDGRTIIYYFYSGKLARIDLTMDGYTQKLTVKEFSSSVPSSQFQLPKGYTFIEF